MGLGTRKRGQGRQGNKENNHTQCPMPNAQCPMPNALFQQIVDNLLKNHLYLSVHFNS
ncbi:MULTISPECIES: hypothetical protein [unclassified Nostoc]|uniref:hypothetical protein n=1 Tax=unclassified Nostoc TaxID=2593658 RepID=UPI00261A76E1|nr:hypothetical protein [Nostoc sp. S13]MDF5739061.1 hypothetical protein [Nostoc sp. S13]